MASFERLTPGATYLNPVLPQSCPDPFVLKYCGEYWAYCTGLWPDGRCFGVWHSQNLIGWEHRGGALEPLPGHAPCYWAPEVIYENGRFLMYYSVGDEEHMEIRVALAEQPGGPFTDSSRRLTHEEFAIDPHVFVDDDGARYLFYATDFLHHSHIGTGTVYDRMLDAFTLAGQPRPVSRPRYAWQVYDPQRREKGGVCWHTVEGPFVLKHKGRYYQMFSGGNWKNTSYGIGYAVSDRIERPDEWEQVCDGERVLPIVRTLPGQVVGPGHNSVVRGPDNRQLFCVYHRWTAEGGNRALSIDRLDWVGDRLVVLGPSITPQPAPLSPSIAGFSGADYKEGLGPEWNWVGGRWSVHAGEAHAGEARQEWAEASAEARARVNASSFLLEVSLRAAGDPSEPGAFGVRLYGDHGLGLNVALAPQRGQIAISGPSRDGELEQDIIPWPRGLEPRVYHRLRLEVNGLYVNLALDEVAGRWEGRLAHPLNEVALFTQNMSAAFAGLALTVGWEDLFMQPSSTPRTLGWEANGPDSNWYLEDRQLWCANAQGPATTLVKGPPLESYELVINARLAAETAAEGCYGFYPAWLPDGPGLLFTVERATAGWVLRGRNRADAQVFPLPADFDPFDYKQFRFRKQRGHLIIQWETQVLGDAPAPSQATRVGLYVRQAIAAFDMVRVTAIKEI